MYSHPRSRRRGVPLLPLLAVLGILLLIALIVGLGGMSVWRPAQADGDCVPTTTQDCGCVSDAAAASGITPVDDRELSPAQLSFREKTFTHAARVAENALTPMIAAGTMTLTLYATHLVFITLADIETLPVLWFAIQIGVAGLFATAWHFSLGRGPLERVVATSSRAVSAAVNRAGLMTGRHSS